MTGWITILTVGTRGEVSPCVALGLGLQAAGYRVCIATHAQFESSVRDAGLNFALIEANPQAFLAGEAGRALVTGGPNPIRTFRTLAQTMRPMLRRVGEQCWEACQGVDLVLYTIGGQFFAPHIAEKSGIPAIAVYPYPAGQPTRAFPSIFAPTQRSLGGLLNRWTHLLFDALAWLLLRGPINAWRKEQLGLPPCGPRYPARLRKRQMPMCYGFSRHVVPRPPDWGRHVHLTGYWFLDRADGWRPPDDLVRFLRAGPPPVYVGFGSMQAGDDVERVDLVLRALDRAGQRGILLRGQGRLATNGHVYVLDSVPFDWLFPRLAAVVHHGGAGTTAAGLCAGVPSVIVPFFMDQPFWGQRVVDLGVGPAPIPQKRLTVERLTAAIQKAVGDREMRSRAQALGARIRAEDGVDRAVAVIRRYAG
jgi:UDP:flavonoid glycosyltransferase YjiC (YdhE family)